MPRSVGVGAVAVALTIGLVACAPLAPPGSSNDAASGSAAFALDENFPDPDVIAVGDRYAAFATGTHGLNIQMATSSTLDEWTVERRDALPKLPAWASPGRTWAPDVAEAPAGGYVMYFTAEHRDSGRQCIGVATSGTIDGDFAAVSDEPLVCPVDEGGAIDASTFDDLDGTRYLLWKTDGNCCDLPTWIEIAPLSTDGLTLAGLGERLLTQTLAWEGRLVEAPVLVARDGRYVLFYSANDYGGDAYTVGVATSDALLGPYEKNSEPLLSTEGSGGAYLGPGGQDVVATPAGDVLVFHSWDELYIYRGLHARPLVWTDAGATVSVGG